VTRPHLRPTTRPPLAESRIMPITSSLSNTPAQDLTVRLAKTQSVVAVALLFAVNGLNHWRVWRCSPFHPRAAGHQRQPGRDLVVYRRPGRHRGDAGYAAFLLGPAVVGFLVNQLGIHHAMAVPAVLCAECGPRDDPARKRRRLVSSSSLSAQISPRIHPTRTLVRVRACGHRGCTCRQFPGRSEAGLDP
jgi:hypothetical protein